MPIQPDVATNQNWMVPKILDWIVLLLPNLIKFIATRSDFAIASVCVRGQEFQKPRASMGRQRRL